MSDRDAPVVIDLEGDTERPSPADAPPVADIDAAPTGQAMQTMAVLAARRGSSLVAWFWRLAGAVVLFLVSVALWEFVTGLMARSPLLGGFAAALIGLFAVVLLANLLRELAALSRLRRVETLQSAATAIMTSRDLLEARAFAERIAEFYADREDTSWGRQRLRDGAADAFDAGTVLALAEDAVMAPLDAVATREVEAAARQVATVTALVPLAFADVLAALTANVRMIRRIAEVYGGRSGTFGGWQLTRAVFTHLVATGAVAVGDDMLSSVGGGHLLGKVSRRFGEGLINGALTARVGVAAMEVCRPLPFSEGKRPRVTALVRRSLTGLFDRDG